MMENFKVHVYPSDCDSVGHVNHAHMLTLLERARWSTLERHMSYEEYMRTSLWAVVRKVEASYQAQTFPGDDLSIRTCLTAGWFRLAMRVDRNSTRVILMRAPNQGRSRCRSRT